MTFTSMYKSRAHAEQSKQEIKCDVTNSNPLAPVVLPKAGAVLTVGCLECACKDLDTYWAVLRNLSSLLKIGGHLIITSILGSTSFMSGSKQFSILTLEEEFLRKAVMEAGLAIKDLELLPRDYDKEVFQFCDYDCNIYLVACKKNDV
ncbi:indolethylamine N-methyltransferase-like [Rhinatrema bivittatum]|uniref:indolethylamine N-methyltransferase-like n=1 Tax=Rhinatrema bivittatum TaxID=194408 RepID=UPI001125DB7B|nr:indolethylamine N-methyltransferase-like [Rhinatrema bivittatum]